MQRALAATTAIAIGLLATACAKSGKDNSAQRVIHGPAWKLTLKTEECADYIDEYCIARHGFTVSADGRFQLGPTPEGKTEQGILGEEDFNKVQSILNEALAPHALVAGGGERCEDASVAKIGLQELSLVRQQQSQWLLRGTLEQVCVQSVSSELAYRLHRAMQETAEKYYSLPFPDACAESVGALHALYAPLQACQSAADCSYVTQNYDVVPSSGSQFVMTDSCSLVHPLIVGNAAAVAKSQPALLNALESARNACGARILRESCTGVDGFESSVGQPVCERGYCRVSQPISVR